MAEHSVYVHPAARGQGIGRPLLDALIASTKAAGIWTIQSGPFPENTAGLALHQAAGFRVVGVRERIGQHHGRWRDVVLIERRSPVVRPRGRPRGTFRAARRLRDGAQETAARRNTRRQAPDAIGADLARSYVIQGMRMLAVTWANNTRGN